MIYEIYYVFKLYCTIRGLLEVVDYYKNWGIVTAEMIKKIQNTGYYYELQSYLNQNEKPCFIQDYDKHDFISFHDTFS
jgi:hypothetical protein